MALLRRRRREPRSGPTELVGTVTCPTGDLLLLDFGLLEPRRCDGVADSVRRERTGRQPPFGKSTSQTLSLIGIALSEVSEEVLIRIEFGLAVRAATPELPSARGNQSEVLVTPMDWHASRMAQTARPANEMRRQPELRRPERHRSGIGAVRRPTAVAFTRAAPIPGTLGSWTSRRSRWMH